MRTNRMVAGAWLLALLLGGMAAMPALRAQPATGNADNRVLLVFETSSAMKRCLPAVQKASAALLAASMNGQLHSNDTIGVWTFDQELRTGQFPLQHWKSDTAAAIASSINGFVGSQRYSGKPRFDVLVPRLGQVVGGSRRLTVVIFCSGNGELHGTPYDTGINQIFPQHRDERQKAKLPIVMVIRSQLGEYVNCMVSFPPQAISLPGFPPLPEPPPPAPKAPAPPRPTAPPLIIIGTPPTNRVTPPVTIVSTPAPPGAQEAKAPDNLSLMRTGAIPVQPTVGPALLPQTNAVPSPSKGTGPNRRGMRVLGVVLLVLAGGLVAFMLGRAWPKKKI